MAHIAHEQRLVGSDGLVPEQFANHDPLVHRTGVHLSEIPDDVQPLGLYLPVPRGDGAQEKDTHALPVGIFQHLARPGQQGDHVLIPVEHVVVMAIQLLDRRLGKPLAIEVRKREIEPGAKLPLRPRLGPKRLEHRIRRRKNRREIVHERPGPVEDQVADGHYLIP